MMIAFLLCGALYLTDPLLFPGLAHRARGLVMRSGAEGEIVLFWKLLAYIGWVLAARGYVWGSGRLGGEDGWRERWPTEPWMTRFPIAGAKSR